MAIAQAFNLKVWLETSRRKAIDCYKSEIIDQYLIDDPRDAQIHILPIGHMNYHVRFSKHNTNLFNMTDVFFGFYYFSTWHST